jgi:excisionase family DNA binding protein
MDRRPLATAEEVSTYLGVPIDTLYAWRSRGKGPVAHKVGRFLRWRWEAVEAWLDEHRQAV